MPDPATDPIEGSPAGPLCKHEHTQVIAEDDDTRYLECLDCGEIFEAGELADGSGFEGSLSDA
jgi:hypothetical protein